jgi:ectoine hydroxylase-related dioxygenase (phytanoyl-CoA dioxygenase family)
MTAEHKKQLKEQGFCKIEGVFSEKEIDAVVAEITRLQQAKEEGWKTSSGTLRAHISRDSELMKRFVRDPRLVSPITEILSGSLRLYWDQIFIKPGPEGKQFPWHQDNGYAETEPLEYFTYWIALCDVPTEKGAIRVKPGSHKNGVIPHVQNAEGHWVVNDPDEGQPAPCKKGDMLLFSSLTLHRSGTNQTTEPRLAYIVQYCAANTVDFKTKQPFTDRALLDVAKNGQCLQQAFM